MKKYKIAVLDDYQNVALESADWSVLRDRADIAVFQDHLADPEAAIERLLPFHPFRTLDNVLATPHIGYVSHGLYKTFYEDTVSNIRRWLDTHRASEA
jgi:phosphoglycerate dehydrogenase-like enzyme